MRSETSFALRSVASFVAAALCSAALIVGTVSPAQAAEPKSPQAVWTKEVTRQLDGNIRNFDSIPAFMREKAAAVVAAKFDADGNFVDCTLERRTGHKLLDREAVRAVRAIEFPQLPVSMRGKRQVVAMEVFFGSPAAHPAPDQIRLAANAVLQQDDGQDMTAFAARR